jgi:hypothetical protein
MKQSCHASDGNLPEGNLTFYRTSSALLYCRGTILWLGADQVAFPHPKDRAEGSKTWEDAEVKYDERALT